MEAEAASVIIAPFVNYSPTVEVAFVPSATFQSDHPSSRLPINPLQLTAQRMKLGAAHPTHDTANTSPLSVGGKDFRVEPHA
jgi:hypothetical protein